MVTLADAKTWTPKPHQIAAAEAVFMAKAYTETVRPIVEGYQQKIINECRFKDKYGRPLLHASRSYQLTDEDFKDYDDFCQDEAKKAGFNVPAGYCPLLIAEEQERQAKRNLAECMIEDLRPMVPGLTLEMLLRRLEDYKKFIDLTLRLLAPYVKGAKKA